MKKIKQLSITGVAFAFVLSSCSMDKRVYTSGYHIEWNKGNQSLDKTSSGRKFSATTKNNESTVTTEQSETAIGYDLEESENDITASTDNSIFIPTSQKIDWNFSKNKTNKNLDSTKVKKEVYRITKNDGSILIGEIISDDGREVLILTKNIGKIFVNKSDIQEMKIIWGDGNDNHQVGKHDVSHQDYHQSTNTNSSNFNNQETHWAAIAGLACGILGFFTIITSIPAIVFSIIALSKIKKNPDKYKGKGMAIAGLVLGGIVFLLCVLIIVAVIATLP
jgi:hypothetical protein